MQKKYDVIVLGGGVAGLGAAGALARPGKKILVLTPSGVKGQSSPAAGGILDPFLEMKLRSPFLPFCVRAFREWPADVRRLEKNTSMKAGYQKSGMLYVAFNREEERLLKKRFLWQRRVGIPVSWRGPEWISKHEPEVSPKAVGGIFYPTIGRVQPAVFLRALKADAVKRGVKILETAKPPRLLIRGGRVAGVFAGKDFYPCSAAVNASGCWAGAVRTLGGKLPVQPVRGQIVITEKKKLRIRSVLHTVDGGYIVPWDPDTLLLGSTVEKVGFNPKVTSAGLRAIRRKNERLVPALRSRKMVDSWAGLRPFPKDRFPLIGASKVPGLYVAAGFYRSGILIGRYAGKLLARGIFSGRMPRELKPFDPERFS